MNVGAVCLSHSPLRGTNRPDAEKEAKFDAAISAAARFVSEQQPELAIVFYPDHVNGFFYGLLPSFCVGIEGRSIGDYGTAAGKLDIPEREAADLSRFLIEAGIDTAISYDMKVDHGAVQPIEWLAEAKSAFPIIPVFINCACDPRPRFERVYALGKAVGNWANKSSKRVLIIGSGGLSHDPPVPTIASATPEIRRRLVYGEDMDHRQRFARQSRTQIEGIAMASGKSSLLAANAVWDRMLLDAFVAGDLTILDKFSDESITASGGRGGHETRTWIAALATLGPNYAATELYYDVIDEWITGMGVLQAVAA